MVRTTRRGPAQDVLQGRAPYRTSQTQHTRLSQSGVMVLPLRCAWSRPGPARGKGFQRHPPMCMCTEGGRWIHAGLCEGEMRTTAEKAQHTRCVCEWMTLQCTGCVVASCLPCSVVNFTDCMLHFPCAVQALHKRYMGYILVSYMDNSLSNAYHHGIGPCRQHTCLTWHGQA